MERQVNRFIQRLAKEPRNLVTLFDFITTDMFQASVVISTVKQDFDYACFEEEASTGNIAGEST